METLRQQPGQSAGQAGTAPPRAATTRQKILFNHPETQCHENQAEQDCAQEHAPQYAARGFPETILIHSLNLPEKLILYHSESESDIYTKQVYDVTSIRQL